MFDDLVASMDATLFSVFGTAGMYDTTIPVSVVINRDVLRQTETGEVVSNKIELVFNLSEANPQIGKTVVTATQTFTITKILARNETTITVAAR